MELHSEWHREGPGRRNLCRHSVLDQANERMSSCSGLSSGLILVWVLGLTWSEGKVPIERIDVRLSHPHIS